MTAGSEWKHVLFFSLPILAGNLLQQLYNTVDGIVVGNFVSESALGSVGSCMELATVFLAIALGMSTGSAILVSQLFGARRVDELRRAASTALILLVSIGAVLSLAGVFGARWLLNVVMAMEPGEMLEMAVSYFSVYAAGLIFQFLYNIIAAILRGIGDSRATLYFLCVAAVLNLLLDLLFVIVFRWGVTGAAAATVIAQFTCALVSWLYMREKYEMFRFKMGEMVFDVQKCKTCLRLGVPTTLQQCTLSFGHVLVQRLVNSFGQYTMSAFTVGNRIQFYAFTPAMSFNAGMAMFSGQNIGAGKPERAIRGLRSTIVMAVISCAVVSTLVYVFAVPIASLFGLGGEALKQAVEFIRFIAFLFTIMAVYLPMAGMLQGSGDVFYATLCTFSALICRVATAYIMAGLLDAGYSSTWKTMPIGWAVAFTMALIRVLHGKWRQKGLLKTGDRQRKEEVTADVK